jgi:hypothetical protein
MSDTALTLRELFQIDTRDISVRAEPGIDVYEAAKVARQTIAKDARAIRWPWVRQAIADQTSQILDLNVLDALGEAWKKLAEVEEYADPKKHKPSDKNLVPLVEHTIKSQHQPELKILLHGHEIGSVKFSLEFSLTLDGFDLAIQNARIMEIQTGSAKGEGSLSLAGVSLWKHEWAPVRFPGQISLKSGIALRPFAAAAPGSAD